ncbi:MAG: transcriptional repressor NrdR [Phycisphaerales bacterium]|nr:MAG: transcriptional repressor NrdR [Phycisphaerales bacterium]
MLCPQCKDGANKVIDSRLTESGSAIRRRRECLACGRRFTTKERVEQELRLMVIKAGGQRVPYNRDNIFNGMARACYKLDISDEQLNTIVDQVEESLFANHDREVSTEQIGLYVGDHLRRLNQVAYVRFMSVHRKYQTVDEFIEEVSDVRVRVSQDSPDQQSLFGEPARAEP